MPEQTYGWYPSAKNVYEDRRLGTLTPYQKEALYRYKESKYYAPPVTPPEQKARPTPSPARRPGSTSSNASKGSGNNLTLRAKSAPIHSHYKPPPRLNLPTPAQCWSTHVPETEITVPQQSPAPSSRVSASLPRASPQYPQVAQSPAHVPAPTPPPAQPVHKTVRIQSAKFRRDTPTKPQRPVKSAGPVRPSPTQSNPEFTYYQPPPPPVQDVFYDTHETYDPYNTQFSSGFNGVVWPEPSAPSPSNDRGIPERSTSYRASPQRSSAPSPATKPPSGKRTPLRPKAPSPSKMVARMTDEELRDDGCSTPDYNEETRKHGWMMEVHGDPFRMKKVSRRLPYTVRCPEPEVARDPPKVHMENNETFFLNTIPKRPMAFTIDKEWISEIIHKKRMEMQAKHGLNYRFKNFSFVY